MTELKMTKNELRAQQNRLHQLEKYLPTLQLKKALLQVEITGARVEITKCEEVFKKVHAEVDNFSSLLVDQLSIDLKESAKIIKINKRHENIAGVEVPYFDSIVFADFNYNLFDTPAWVDSVIIGLRTLAEAQIRVEIARQKMMALENEWREVSIRVNLFEKILIPRAIANMKKIKVFLGDQQLAAVSQAKVAKNKIEENKQALQNKALCVTM